VTFKGRRPRDPLVVLLRGGLPIKKPEITAKISRRRLPQARELEVEPSGEAYPALPEAPARHPRPLLPY
jgi:hypothetical protein